MYQQLWGYKVEEKLYLGVREQKRLNTTGLDDRGSIPTQTGFFLLATTSRPELGPTLPPNQRVPVVLSRR
jgi:hypothetical protein